MRRFVTNALVIGVVCGGTLATLTSRLVTADEDQAVLQVDHALVQAIGRTDKTAVGKLLDANFTWTDADGKTLSRVEVLHVLPTPVTGYDGEAEERTYGQVGTVQAASGKVRVLRVWVKRPVGWRALVYHEVKMLDQPPTTAGSSVNNCENPCKTVPYKPKNEAEQGVIVSWQALETGVTAHDAAAWAPHIADEFVQINSNSDHPITKADRIATLNKQKQLGVGSAPAPLVSARMYDIGDTVVMTCLHQPYHGKPVHVSRIWIKRDGKWVMSISYQTTIQAAPPKS